MGWIKKNLRNLLINWSTLQKLQDQRVVKSMYLWLFLVPLFGNALQKLPPIIAVNIGSLEFDLVATLPFSWTLFYASSLFFVIGHLIFFAFCPALVREHGGLTHFLEQGKSAKELWEYAENASLDWNELRRRADVTTPPAPGETIEERFQRIFWETFKAANLSNAYARGISTFFYVVGLLLIACVVANNSWTVLQIALR